MNKWMVAVAMSVVAGTSYAGNLCSINPFSKAEAEQGKVAFESHCGLCHQYNMTGRQPGRRRRQCSAADRCEILQET
jgi:cytochrome c